MNESDRAASSSPFGDHFQTAVALLAGATTPSEILNVVLRAALQATGARQGAALLLGHPTSGQLAGAEAQAVSAGVWLRVSESALTGMPRLEEWPAEAIEQPSESAASERFLAAEALRQGQALFFERAALRPPQLPVQQAVAALPLLWQNVPLGALILNYPEAHPFTAAEQQFLQTLAGQAAVALSRQHERTQLLEMHSRAQDVFVAFVENTGLETNLLALVNQAMSLLQASLPEVSAAYFELDHSELDDLEQDNRIWQLRACSPEITPELLGQLRQGVLHDAQDFNEAARNLNVGFVDNWNAAARSLEAAQDYGAVALFTLFPEAAKPGLFTVGTKKARHWTESERVIIRAVQRSLRLAVERSNATQRLERQNAELEARTRALEGFAKLTRDLALDSDEYGLIRRAQQLAQSLLPDGFAVYYEPEDGLWRLKSQVGDLGNPALQAVLDAGLPFAQTQNLLIPWRSRQPFYQDAYDMNLDQQPGEVVGQLQSTATIPVQVGGQMRGVFAFGLNLPSPWRRADKAVLESIALSLGSALERVQKTRRLDAERAALDAFVQFAEVAAHETDVHALARRAVDVLVTTLGRVTVAYYDLEENLWKARAWSSEVPPQLMEFIQQGVPVDTPLFAQALESSEVTFVTGVGTAPETPEKALFGAGAFCPYFVEGRPHGLLTVGIQQARDWTGREQAIIRAVGRSLGLALERSQVARQLRQQNAELEARTRALEGFAELTRNIDFQSEPYALIGRAQQIILSLTPPGYVDYFELEQGRWYSRMRTGERRNPELQALVDQGLAYEPLVNLRRPFERRQPYYQDTYDRQTDHLEAHVQQLGATATLPVCVEGQVQGVLAIGLFDPYRWSAADRAVLETVVRSLELALEGAQGVMALRQRTQELERSNRELEQFAYVASHDLQEPLRTVTSFSQLLLRRLDTHDPKAQRYAQFITEGSERMGQLIQDLLMFSRLATQGREPQEVDTMYILEQVIQDLHANIEQVGAGVSVGALPAVRGDPTQLRQLFQNLIGNALKFTDPERPASVQVSAEMDGRMVRFCVQDNGIGIAPEHFEKIFTIFQRLHRRDEYEGSGIGLAMARRIVEHHGGQIWPESTPGQGTAFYFTLPAA